MYKKPNYTKAEMEDLVFEKCQGINQLLMFNKENEAREELIQLLDYHAKQEIEYDPLVNHLIRQTGLYPYLDIDSANWDDRYVYDLFKVDVGVESPVTLHREQSLLLKKLLDGKNIAVSAPTSFGKSFVIDAFIQLRKPQNVLLIVPTLALTDETRRRLFKKFSKEYKIITTSDVEIGEKNIFIFPQERALNYLDAIESFDMLIVDEFYKASEKFDKDRSSSLIRAMIKLGHKSKQKYYLAPNISNLDDNQFTKDMEFIRLDFNTVFLEIEELYPELRNDAEKSEALLKILRNTSGKSLIYAGTFSNIENLSNLFLTSCPEIEKHLLNQFAEWLAKNYSVNWNLTKLIKRGVGIHNGRLHRSLSQIQVRLFELEDGINHLVSTSSIIEGVNTSAENVILWKNRKGRAKLDDFTYRNIIGRGGRMFKHFIGKIYVLDEPPSQEQTQLDITFPEEIIGDLDETKYEGVLTQEQVAKIKIHHGEMAKTLGSDLYNRLRSESVFQSSNAELIKEIAIDMFRNPDGWNGLGYLNSPKPENWDRMIYKIMNLQGGSWGTRYSYFVGFIKVIVFNWRKSIPELLKELEDYDIGIDEFFQLERTVTFNFAALLKDVNSLQKEILVNKNYDLSNFIRWCSYAFLPKIVFQLEEYGLPRMISKKIHNSKVLNLTQRDLAIHDVIDSFNEIGYDRISQIEEMDEFDKYILAYFFDGISNSYE